MARIIDPVSQEAVGSVKPWIRAASSVPIPTNWVICDGSLVVDPDSPFDSGSGFTIIDLRSRFARGHASLTNANFGVNTNYILGGAGVVLGGADSHSHSGGTDTQGSHSHNVNGHTHGLANHTHTISSDGGHTHTLGAGGGGLAASPGVFTDNQGTHSHTGNTGGSSASTDSAGSTTDSNGSHSHNVSTSGSFNIPVNYGLVYIMRIK